MRSDAEIDAGLREGIAEFNAERFFEAHDTLEDVWMDVRGGDRLFFQGLIQFAIAYYHLSTDNLTGAEHLLTRGIDKLAPYGEACRGVRLAPLVAAAGQTLRRVRASGGGERVVGAWTYPKIVLEGTD